MSTKKRKIEDENGTFNTLQKMTIYLLLTNKETSMSSLFKRYCGLKRI